MDVCGWLLDGSMMKVMTHLEGCDNALEDHCGGDECRWSIAIGWQAETMVCQ